MASFQSRLSAFFLPVPQKYKAQFKKTSTDTNLRRFSVLPYFNIITQIACIFIYLYVYPMVFPDRPAIGREQFLWFTAGYIAINIAGAVVLGKLRKMPDSDQRTRWGGIAVDAFVFCYVCLEASQMAVELEISGNIYRFLATFFLVSFFPVVGRFKRMGFMTLYIIISEIALFYLQTQGVAVYSYPQINIIVFLVCLVATNVHYNSVINNFTLHMDLLEQNKRMEALNEQLKYLSSMDSLTGLNNRRSFSAYYETCWKTAQRLGSSVGVMMIDIDNFKKYNDAFGHQQGDACLVMVAESIRRQFGRATDMCARYGGEEFVVLLPYTAEADVPRLAQKVCDDVAALALPHPSNPPYDVVTVSVGVAVHYPALGDAHEELLKRADDALYQAKDQGRNRIAIAQSLEEEPVQGEAR